MISIICNAYHHVGFFVFVENFSGYEFAVMTSFDSEALGKQRKSEQGVALTTNDPAYHRVCERSFESASVASHSQDEREGEIKLSFIVLTS